MSIFIHDCLSATGVNAPGKAMAVGGSGQLIFKRSANELYQYDVQELSSCVLKLSKPDPLFDDCQIYDFSFLRGGSLAICLQRPSTSEIFICEGYINTQEKHIDISGMVYPTRIFALRGKSVGLLHDEQGLVLISHPIRWQPSGNTVELFHVSNFLQQKHGDKYTISLNCRDHCDATFGNSFISRNHLYLFYADDYSKFLLVPLAGTQCGKCHVRCTHGDAPSSAYMCKNIQVFEDFVLLYASMSIRRTSPSFYVMNLTNLKWEMIKFALSHHMPKGKVALQKGGEDYVYLHGDCNEHDCREKAHLYQIDIEPVAKQLEPRSRSQSLNSECIPYPTVSTQSIPSLLQRSNSSQSTPPHSPIIDFPMNCLGKSSDPPCRRYKKKQSKDEIALPKRFSANLKKSSSSSMDKCEEIGPLKRSPSTSSVHWGADMAEQSARSLQDQIRLAHDMGYSQDVVMRALNMRQSDPEATYQPFESTNAMLDCLIKANSLECPAPAKLSIFNGDSDHGLHHRSHPRSSSVSRSSSFHMGTPRPSRPENHDLFRLIQTLDREKERDKREVEQQFAILKTKINDLERERDILRMDVEQLSQEKTEWTTEQRAKNQRISELEDEATTAREKFDRLTIEKMKLEKDVDNLKELSEHRRKQHEEAMRKGTTDREEMEEATKRLQEQLNLKSALLAEQTEYARRMEQRNTTLQSGILLEQIAKQNEDIQKQQQEHANTLLHITQLYQQLKDQLSVSDLQKQEAEKALEEVESKYREELNTLRREYNALLEKTTAECCICLTTKPNVVFMPCRHLAICAGCKEESVQITECPTCRAKIEDSMQIYT